VSICPGVGKANGTENGAAHAAAAAPEHAAGIAAAPPSHDAAVNVPRAVGEKLAKKLKVYVHYESAVASKDPTATSVCVVEDSLKSVGDVIIEFAAGTLLKCVRVSLSLRPYASPSRAPAFVLSRTLCVFLTDSFYPSFLFLARAFSDLFLISRYRTNEHTQTHKHTGAQTHTHTHTYAHVYAYVSTHEYAHSHPPTKTHRHAHKHTHTNTRTHTHAHTNSLSHTTHMQTHNTHTHMHTHTHTHSNSLLQPHTHAHARTHTDTHIDTYTYTLTHTLSHTHTHTHRHTHTHTYTPSHTHTFTQTHTGYNAKHAGVEDFEPLEPLALCARTDSQLVVPCQASVASTFKNGVYSIYIYIYTYICVNINMHI